MKRTVMEAFAEYVDATVESAMQELRAETMRYKGVWAGAAATYRKGDVVTYQGSAWHCNAVDGTSDKPGTSEAWQLMHKSDR